jgi:hypothetical protein
MIPVHVFAGLPVRRWAKREASNLPGRNAANPGQGGVAIPPELTGTIPRNVALTDGGIFLSVLAGTLAAGSIVAAIALSIANARSADAARLRASDGVSAQATVAAARTTRGDSPRRVFTYRYDVDGRAYGGEARVRERDGRSIAAGDRIGIRYMRSAPERSWLAGSEASVDPPIFLIPLISLSMLGAAGALAWAVRRQWQLLAEGRPALARVTASKRVRGQHHHGYRVSYEFQTMSGATVSARSESGKMQPPVGATVAIVYHRESPKWSAVYPLQLVRPQRR